MGSRTFFLPYGKEKIEYTIQDKHLLAELKSKLTGYKPTLSPSDLIKDALLHPIGSKPLNELALGKNKVVIIASDHTRPVPSKVIIPLVLNEIRRGNPNADITILIASGLHRKTTNKELEEKFGDEICKNEKIIIHDCDDYKNMADLGILPSGGKLLIHKTAVDSDLLLAEGFIEPHFFAGFSGGRKSVLPGIASRETVMYNHNSAFINSPYARAGILANNPIHQDMLYAAERAKLAFIINVIIDADHNPIYAVAGDYKKAHLKGCAFLKKHCLAKSEEADIVITTNGGYPLDQNIYQSVKGMTTAESAVRKKGVIVMLSKCSDGTGGATFYSTFKNEKNLNKMMHTFLNRKPEETIIDQWQSQILARILIKANVIFVSDCNDSIIENMHMIPAHSIAEAMEKAISIVNKNNYKVTVIPDGVSIIHNSLSGDVAFQ